MANDQDFAPDQCKRERQDRGAREKDAVGIAHQAPQFQGTGVADDPKRGNTGFVLLRSWNLGDNGYCEVDCVLRWVPLRKTASQVSREGFDAADLGCEGVRIDK